MTAFALRDGELHAERVSLASIAERYGTPCFVYSRSAIEGAWRSRDGALAGPPHPVCYAVKENSTLAILD
ncbi:MAG TPA: diaminopimelate decarboxylase, partial [Casimicrobiaceae bacterium]|nr:diaminopimelate decarboxylase [Casimicrobiaceae bacterium]